MPNATVSYFPAAQSAPSGVSYYPPVGSIAAPSGVSYFPLASIIPPSGLVLWLKADDLTGADGSAVSTWTDASGLGNNATQGTGSLQPLLKKAANGINGLNVVRFDGTDDHMQGTFNPGTTGLTVFFIARTGGALDTYAAVLGSSVAATSGCRWQFGLGSDATQGAGWGGSADVNLGAVQDLAINTPYFGRYRISNAGNQWTMDGVNTVTVADATFPSGTFTYTIGDESPASPYELNGDVGEVIVYNRALTDDECDQVKEYLLQKWSGSTAVLPMFLDLGMSNMVGLAPKAGLPAPLDAAQTSIKIYIAPGDSDASVQGQWLSVAPGQGRTTNDFGPEVPWGHDVQATLGATTIIYKNAVGGSNLYTEWLSPSSGTPGVYWTRLTSSAQYSLKWALTRLRLGGFAKSVTMRGVIIQLGEADALVDASTANAFQARMVNLISDLRAQFGSTLPIVWQKTEPMDSAAWLAILNPNWGTTIRAAQVAVAAATSRFTLISPDDLTYIADGIHFDQASMLTLGGRYATAMAALL